jgi:hypothetical protein
MTMSNFGTCILLCTREKIGNVNHKSSISRSIYPVGVEGR